MEAMSVYLRFKRMGGTREELLAEHPHLHDLLVTLLDDNGDEDDDESLSAQNATPGDLRSTTLEAGQTVGDFRLVRCLGGGGMGTVWEAEQRSLNRRVALKMLFGLGQMDVRRLARFRREAEAGGRMTHPSIVAVYGVGEADGVAYIAQELVPEGRTLGDRLDERRAQLAEGIEPTRRYERDIAHYFAAVADAMQAAHDARVIHRDLKPSNLLMTADRKPKVADFGLAWVHSELHVSQSGDLVGTPYYMSPEQIRGARDEIDERTDVFSLGSTLYEALTLQRAFEATTSVAVFHDIQVKDPTPPHTLCSWVSQDLSAICLHALAKNPDARYPNMAAFAADLRAFLSGRPVVARAPGKLDFALRWMRRHAILVVTSILAIAALAVSAYFFDEMRSLLSRMEDSSRVTNRFYAEGLASAVDDDTAYEPLVAEVSTYISDNLGDLPELQFDMLQQLTGITLGRRRTASDVALVADGLARMSRWAAELDGGDVRSAAIALRRSRFLRERGLFDEAADTCRVASAEATAQLGNRHPMTQTLEAEAALVAWHGGDFSAADPARTALRSLAAQLRSLSQVATPSVSAALPPLDTSESIVRSAARRTLADIAAVLGEWDEASELYAALVGPSTSLADLREHLEVRAQYALAVAARGELEEAYNELLRIRDERIEAFGRDASDTIVDELRLHHVRLDQGETLGLLGAQNDALAALRDPGRGEARSLARLDGLTDLARLHRTLSASADAGDRLVHADDLANTLQVEVEARRSIQSDRHPAAIQATQALQLARTLPLLDPR